MESITVKTDDLLVKLQENKNLHVTEYKNLTALYRKSLIEKFNDTLELLDTENVDVYDIELHFGLPIPQDHSNDYDNAIAMLEMTTQEEIQLSESDFMKFVRNQWNWSHGTFEISKFYSGNSNA